MYRPFKVEIKHLIVAIFLFLLLVEGTFASPPVLYKPVPLGQHEDHRYFNRLISDPIDLNSSDLKVAIIYLIPTDIQPNIDAASRARTLALSSQTFFAIQMAMHGYQTLNGSGKTFELVQDTSGNVAVLNIKAANSLSHYRLADNNIFDPIKKELIEKASLQSNYPFQKCIYLVIVEGLEHFGISAGQGGQFGPSGGMAVIPRGSGDTDAPAFDMSTIAHELGHAFGLDHDFRSELHHAPPVGKSYVMSYDHADEDNYVLSACNAAYLDVDRFFNRQNFANVDADGSDPRIEINSPLAYTSNIASHQVEVSLSDSDGLHQIQFSMITDVQEGHQHEAANGSPALEFCQLVSGTIQTLTYNYGTHLMEGAGIKSIMAQARRLHIKVVDRSGQESHKTFAIYDQNRIPTIHRLNMGQSLKQLLQNVWPKDEVNILGRPVETDDLFIEIGQLTFASANLQSPQLISARLIIDGAKDTRLENLLLNGVSLQSQATAVRISNCTIQSDGIAGVYIDGESSAILTGNTIQNCSQWGIYTKLKSAITIGGPEARDKNLIKNNGYGIQLETVGTTDQPVLIQGNQILQNTQSGISLYNSMVSLFNNEIQQNGGDGLAASKGSQVTLGGLTSAKQNKVFNNTQSGIALYDEGTKATITNNIIQQNQGVAGLYINNSVQAHIIGNVIQDNSQWGIYGKPKAQITIGGTSSSVRNIVEGNSIGIQLEGVGTVENPSLIMGNLVQKNAQDAIVLSAGAVVLVGGEGISSGNTIINNDRLGVLVYGSKTNVDIKYNTVRSNGSTGISLEGTISAASIANNIIKSNAGEGIYIHHDTTMAEIPISNNLIADNKGGIYSFSSITQPISVNNLVFKNNRAIAEYGGRGFQLSGNAIIINSTVVGHTGDAALLAFGAEKTVKVYNSIFAQNTNDWYAEGISLVENCLFDKDLPQSITEVNNWVGDPKFVDAAKDDYHLQGLSPAINVGNNAVSGLPDKDLTGHLRIFSNTVDLGVYEYGSRSQVIPNDVAEIPDANLRAVLEQALDKNDGDAITKEDLVGLTRLNLHNLGITNLTGLEFCTNLTNINLGDGKNKASDLSPLTGLIKLKSLTLHHNDVSNLSPLKNLINLETLNIGHNKFSDIEPLKNLVNLRRLHIFDTPVSDISSLSNLVIGFLRQLAPLSKTSITNIRNIR